MQQKPRPFEPHSPEVPTETDMNTIAGAIHMLEGKNSVLSQIVYAIVLGRYGGLSQTRLADSLS
jgi:hypothetical protein